jgi:hypothetical protein
VPDVHLCHMRPDCSVPVPPRLLFCAPHWRMVPRPLQARIHDSLRRWKKPGAPTKAEQRAAMMEWFDAVQEAKAIIRGAGVAP